MGLNPPTRRRVVTWLGKWLGLAGLGCAAMAAGSSRNGRGPEAVRTSLQGVRPGEMLELEWGGKPVFVRRRTREEIDRERAVPLATLRDPERDQDRTRRPEWVVVEGVCTHGGCIPNGPLGDYGGWYCLCHGSQFDTAGRVRAGPARENLPIPPYRFLGELALEVGGGPGQAGAMPARHGGAPSR